MALTLELFFVYILIYNFHAFLLFNQDEASFMPNEKYTSDRDHYICY